MGWEQNCWGACVFSALERHVLACGENIIFPCCLEGNLEVPAFLWALLASSTSRGKQHMVTNSAVQAESLWFHTVPAEFTATRWADGAVRLGGFRSGGTFPDIRAIYRLPGWGLKKNVEGAVSVLLGLLV